MNRATDRLAIAVLCAAAGCSRSRPPPAGEAPAAAVRPDAAAAAVAAVPAPYVPEFRGPDRPLLTEQKLSPELAKLVAEGHAHPAVPSLEAAGCELALVMTGARYDRFFDLQHELKMPPSQTDSRQLVVWCQRRTGDLPDCTEVAPIFARVARPKRPFVVYSGSGDPPFSPLCVGTHDRKGKSLGGSGPKYPSKARL